jgi:hypothetical protein
MVGKDPNISILFEYHIASGTFTIASSYNNFYDIGAVSEHIKMFGDNAALYAVAWSFTTNPYFF